MIVHCIKRTVADVLRLDNNNLVRGVPVQNLRLADGWMWDTARDGQWRKGTAQLAHETVDAQPAVAETCDAETCDADPAPIRRSRTWPLLNSLRVAYDAPSPSRSYQVVEHLRVSWELILHDLICGHMLARNTAVRLTTVHIHAMCHFILLISSCGLLLYWLSSTLLPVLLGAGISVVLEPLVCFLIDIWVRCFRVRPTIHGYVGSTLRVELSERSASSCQGPETWLASFTRRVWCVVTVAFTMTILLSITGGVAVWVIASINSVDWNKYLEGERLSEIRKLVEGNGVEDFDSAVHELIETLIASLGVQLIDSTYSLLTGFLLTLLFVGFFLIDTATERSVSKEPWRPVQRKIIADMRREMPDMSVEDDRVPLMATFMGKLRLTMRVYIKSKFWLSVFKAVVIGCMYFLLKVDLWPVWTILTFVLNFIPLGSAVSTAAPIPFIFLDSSKPWAFVAVCVLWPIIVHNVVGNVVEPRVFAHSLNLKPFVVLFSLTFWGFLWGILGALVCVPMTAAIRIILREFMDHPYVSSVVALLEGAEPPPRKQSKSPCHSPARLASEGSPSDQ